MYWIIFIVLAVIGFIYVSVKESAQSSNDVTIHTDDEEYDCEDDDSGDLTEEEIEYDYLQQVEKEQEEEDEYFRNLHNNWRSFKD